MNLKPLTNDKQIEDTKNVKPAEELRSLEMKEALKKYPFYALALTLCLMNGAIVTFLSQYASYFKSLNFEAAEIALIMTGLGASLTCNKILFGVLIDKFGVQGANCFLFFAWIATLSSLLFVDFSVVFVLIFVIFSGNLAVVTTVATPLWIASMFGDKNYPVFIGSISACTNIGAVFFPIVLGHFIDFFGYKAVFAASLATVCVLCTLMTFAIKSAIATRKTNIASI